MLKIFVNIDSSYGLSADSTKSLPEPKDVRTQCSLVTVWGVFFEDFG